MEDHDPAEDRVSLLVGKIIRRWGRIDQWVWNEIGSMQMMVKGRHMRFPRALYPDVPGDFVPSLFEDFHPPAGDKVNQRFRHCKRLARALTSGDETYTAYEALLDEALSLYTVRNDLAHADVSFEYLADPPSVTLRCKEWAEDFQQEHERRRDDLKGLPQSVRLKEARKLTEWVTRNWDLSSGRKTYPLDELIRVAERLDRLWWDLREASSRIPVRGDPLPPVSPPPSRGRRPPVPK